MDAPPIQYAKTSDGVNIAYWAIGKGPPLVVLSSLVASHIQLEWELEFRRTAYELLAQRATVIRYDCRGVGLSQRDRLDFSTEAAVLDLEAVVNSLGLDSFALYGPPFGELILAYPGAHPQRISHLVVNVPPVPAGISASSPSLGQSLIMIGTYSPRLRGASREDGISQERRRSGPGSEKAIHRQASGWPWKLRLFSQRRSWPRSRRQR